MSMTRTDLTRSPGRARRQVRPTVRGAVFLGVGAALFVLAWAYDERDLLFVAGVLLLVPIVALGFVLVHPLRVSVTRAFRPGTVSAGSSAAVTIQIRNLAPSPLPGLCWRDTAAKGVIVPPSQPLRALAPARAGRSGAADTTEVSYQLQPARRGVYPVGPLMLGRSDPFGLAYSEWPVGAPHDLTVTPRVTPLPGNGVSITTGEGSRHERVRHLNNDSDELIAREYRPGDPMRRVNWPATARHGEIMVRQEEQRSHPEARIILDTSRGGRGAGLRHDAEFERAVELAASIAVHLLEGGFRLDVVELGPCQLLPGRPVPGDPRAPHDPDEGRRGGLRGDDPASFSGPEGVLALVDALAIVVQRDRVVRAANDDVVPGRGHLAASALGRQVPSLAVLVDIGPADTSDLVALRGLCQPAVAFVFDTMGAASIDRLNEAGWHCVPVGAATQVAAAWARAGQDREEAR
ncbi:DUF58 domain-containing protein [Cryobacterium adonitolivorans]|nr:DUF58 domain-containing protein [Cryobacterium adonitolivorans]